MHDFSSYLYIPCRKIDMDSYWNSYCCSMLGIIFLFPQKTYLHQSYQVLLFSPFGSLFKILLLDDIRILLLRSTSKGEINKTWYNLYRSICREGRDKVNTLISSINGYIFLQYFKLYTFNKNRLFRIILQRPPKICNI